jgi:hypothetical protein
MHDAAFAWLTDLAVAISEAEVDAGRAFHTGQWRAIDVGAGGELGKQVRHLWPWARWDTVDWNPDTEPDVVADMTTLVLPPALPAEGYNLVLCTEVLEHVPAWRALLFNCVRLVGPTGHLVVTTAGPDREPHSALDGGPLREGEHYANMDPDEMAATMVDIAQAYGLVLRQLAHDPHAHDIYLHMEAQHARQQG